MRNTTVHLPELYIKLIDEIINEKDYPCLSEFIRVAIRKMLKKDFKLLNNEKLAQFSGKIKIFDEERNTIYQTELDQPQNSFIKRLDNLNKTKRKINSLKAREEGS